MFPTSVCERSPRPGQPKRWIATPSPDEAGASDDDSTGQRPRPESPGAAGQTSADLPAERATRRAHRGGWRGRPATVTRSQSASTSAAELDERQSPSARRRLGEPTLMRVSAIRPDSRMRTQGRRWGIQRQPQTNSCSAATRDSKYRIWWTPCCSTVADRKFRPVATLI